ncbi:MAG: hypothetical protein ABIF92_02835, partial [archaeon]
SEKSLSSMYYEITADAAVSGYSTGKVSIGGVSSGESRSIKIPLIVSKTASTGGKSITIKIWYSGGTESPVQKTFSFNVGSAVSLYLSSIEYDHEHIEPGKDVALKAIVTNVGDNPAYDVFGGFSADTEYIKPVLSGGEYFITALEPGQSAEFWFTMNVDADAETETYDATIKMSFKDEFGASNTESFEVGIPVSGTPRIEVLNTEIDGTDFKVEMENLGTAKAKAIRISLVQDGKVMGVKIDNELKPDKASTLRFKAFKRGTGELKMHYLDEENTLYEETIDVEVPGSSGSISKWAVLFFFLAAFEGFLIYRIKKNKPIKLPLIKKLF